MRYVAHMLSAGQRTTTGRQTLRTTVTALLMVTTYP